jgi:hypothetical protein
MDKLGNVIKKKRRVVMLVTYKEFQNRQTFEFIGKIITHTLSDYLFKSLSKSYFHSSRKRKQQQQQQQQQQKEQLYNYKHTNKQTNRKNSKSIAVPLTMEI